jgi:hypothetical protein
MIRTGDQLTTAPQILDNLQRLPRKNSIFTDEAKASAHLEVNRCPNGVTCPGSYGGDISASDRMHASA